MHSKSRWVIPQKKLTIALISRFLTIAAIPIWCCTKRPENECTRPPPTDKNRLVQAPCGMMLVGLKINLGRFDSASNLLKEVKALIPESDRQGQQLIDAYEAAINQRLLEDFRPGPNTRLNFQLESDNDQ